MCLRTLTHQRHLRLPCHLRSLWPSRDAERWLAHCLAAEKGPGQRRANWRSCPALWQRTEPAAVALAHARNLHLTHLYFQHAITKTKEQGFDS